MSTASIWEDKKLPLNGLCSFYLFLKRSRQVKLSNTRQDACALMFLCKFPLKELLRANQADMKCLCDMLEQIILTVPLENVTFPRQTLTTTYTEVNTFLF